MCDLLPSAPLSGHRALISVPRLGAVLMAAAMLFHPASAQPADSAPAFVLVERLATTGPESVQEDYSTLAKEILPKYGGIYLARSQVNTVLEGPDPAPCCVAILQFPSIDAAKRWYASPENQAAAKVRQSGARFRLLAVTGLSAAEKVKTTGTPR